MPFFGVGRGHGTTPTPDLTRKSLSVSTPSRGTSASTYAEDRIFLLNEIVHKAERLANQQAGILFGMIRNDSGAEMREEAKSVASIKNKNYEVGIEASISALVLNGALESGIDFEAPALVHAYERAAQQHIKALEPVLRNNPREVYAEFVRMGGTITAEKLYEQVLENRSKGLLGMVFSGARLGYKIVRNQADRYAAESALAMALSARYYANSDTLPKYILPQALPPGFLSSNTRARGAMA